MQPHATEGEPSLDIKEEFHEVGLLDHKLKHFGVWARRFRRAQTSKFWKTERQVLRKLLGSPKNVILRFPRAAIDYETTMTGPLRDG